MKHVHLIGIGGTGLSAIALVLLESGYGVSGSDRQASVQTQRLEVAGAQVYYGHRAENIAGADLVVRSSAVSDENIEVQAALAAGIPVLKRADFLGQLMVGQMGIAVAGTHGKTTTTAMVAWMLTALDKDPSYIIGGVSANLGNNAHAGKGGQFVIEADEYDRMFLGLRPHIAVVTNVEHDHPDCYPTYSDFYQAFQSFVNCVQPGGVLVACGENAGAANLLAYAAAQGQRSLSYGIQREAGVLYDYAAHNLQINAQGGFCFTLQSGREMMPTPVTLQSPGEHNVRNALAALAVADQLGLSLAQAAQALGEYCGTGRRFEVRGEVDGVTVVDDYAHHPTEIRATLAAARSRYAQRSLWAVWQPHTYSRTRTLFDLFVAAFDDADHVVITEIYAAREAFPADGFSSRQVVEAMSTHSGGKDVYFASSLAAARDHLLAHVQSGDVVLVLSAGDADRISTEILHAGFARHGEDRRRKQDV